MQTRRSAKEIAALRARKWIRQVVAVKAANARRERALWRFMRAFVKHAKDMKLRSKPDFQTAVREIAPLKDKKQSARYARILRSVVRGKPRGVSIRDWVRSRGGISRFKDLPSSGRAKRMRRR
jgi:hypothetical protein